MADLPPIPAWWECERHTAPQSEWTREKPCRTCTTEREPGHCNVSGCREPGVHRITVLTDEIPYGGVGKVGGIALSGVVAWVCDAHREEFQREHERKST